MHKRLYELTNDYYSILDKTIDQETGEILNDELVLQLEAIEGERDRKILDLACWIKDLELDAIEHKKQADRLTQDRKHKLALAERLEEYIKASLEEGKKLSDSRAKISWRESSSVEINCELEMLHKLRPDLVREEVEYVADKKLIKKSIDGGDLVLGCAIKTKQNLQIK